MIDYETFRHVLGAMLEQNMLRSAREEGILQGHQLLLKRMLSSNSIEEVVRVTGLTIDELKKLKAGSDEG